MPCLVCVKSRSGMITWLTERKIKDRSMKVVKLGISKNPKPAHEKVMGKYFLIPEQTFF